MSDPFIYIRTAVGTLIVFAVAFIVFASASIATEAGYHWAWGIAGIGVVTAAGYWVGLLLDPDR